MNETPEKGDLRCDGGRISGRDHAELVLASRLVPDVLEKKGSMMGKHKLRKEGHRAGRQWAMMHLQAEEPGGQRQEPSLDKLPQNLHWNFWSISHLILRAPHTYKSS